MRVQVQFLKRAINSESIAAFQTGISNARRAISEEDQELKQESILLV